MGRAPDIKHFAYPQDDTLHPHHTGICLQRDHRWYVYNITPEAPTYVDGLLVTEKFTLIPSGSIVRCGRQAFQVIYGDQDFDRQLHRAEADQASEATRNEIGKLLERNR